MEVRLTNRGVEMKLLSSVTKVIQKMIVSIPQIPSSTSAYFRNLL